MVTLRMAPVGGSPAVDSPKRRILLIEDESAISSLVARALSGAGYAVDCAGTGTDGLQHATSSEYDLVLLDLVMPDLHGREILKGLLAAHPEQAVLARSCLTARTRNVDCPGAGPP